MKFEEVLPAFIAGRKIKRKDWGDWIHIDGNFLFNSRCIRADDWEIEEEKRTLTRSEIERAWNAIPKCGYIGHSASNLLRALGFEEREGSGFLIGSQANTKTLSDSIREQSAISYYERESK